MKMKRVICCLLAVLLLLAALPFAGAEFKDKILIQSQFVTAVNEMAAQGIISGFPDGSFGPRKTLTRAQAAKILCVMLEGAEKTEALTKTETGFSDVPATHWAAKFVAYCVDKGIVAGVGNGKFDPDGQLSTAAFAKMLLVAYGDDAAKYTGANWLDAVRETVDAGFIGFGLTSKVSAKAAKRQEAAQMAYNALTLAEATAATKRDDYTGGLPTALPEKLKVLFIGTSGSADCMLSYLVEFLQEAGVKEMVLGNLRKSSTRLIEHVQYAVTQESVYTYAKSTGGKWKSTEKGGACMDDAVLDEQWDYIVVQHGVSKSGDETTYHPWLEILLQILQKKCPNAILGWNLNWALDYSTKATAYFDTDFGGDSAKMYEALVRASQNQALTDKRLRFTIPVGTALQNARTSYIGHKVTRDGSHLDYGIGRYIAAMTWACTFTGADPAKFTLAPEKLTAGQIAVAKEAVANAMRTPMAITQSKITAEP
ncbi:MAG: DUF4886 domain-containing protein [Oscillospiraceae bacterium]|nr:DUF4886 domain-containing protein [Oscillospiraceae bacterium]MBR3850130.1 DUF4886 domain-containing protein [Oscillospiraceae bacterium]